MTRARFWSALLAAPLVGISATWGILRLHHRTADYGAAALLVSEIETGARHHSAAEWEAIAEQQLEEGEEEDPLDVEAELARTVERLQRLEAEGHLGGVAQARAVRETFQGYQGAVRLQFRQLTTDDSSVTADLDERLVDPAPPGRVPEDRPLVRRRARSRRPGHRHRSRRDRVRQDARPQGDRGGHRDRRAAGAATRARM